MSEETKVELPPLKAKFEPKMFGDMANGGWFQVYENEELGIGVSFTRKSRKAQTVKTYSIGKEVYNTLKDFLTAYWEKYPDRLKRALDDIAEQKAREEVVADV